MNQRQLFYFTPRTLIIPRLPCFEKLALLQLHLYTAAETMTQCFVCRDFKNTIAISADAGEYNVFLYLTHVKDP